MSGIARASCQEYDEAIRALDAAIEAESEAASRYVLLGRTVRPPLVGADPSGRIAQALMSTFASDAAKHKTFLTELRDVLVRECGE